MERTKWYHVFIVIAVMSAVFCGGFFMGRRTAPEAPVMFASPASGEPSDSALININEASQAELALLPGIGESLAGRIIEYRTEHGDFARVEDIMKVSGIGEKIFSGLQDYITVGRKG